MNGTADALETKVDPKRQIIQFLSIAYPMALAVPLLLPKTSNGAPLLSIPIPLIATAIVIALTVPRGRRRAAWGEMRLGRLGFKGWPVAVLLPIAIAVISYAAAALLGVARFPNLPQSLEIGFAAVVNLLIFTIVFMGEEIGWRGFLLPRFAQLTSFRNAALTPVWPTASSICLCISSAAATCRTAADGSLCPSPWWCSSLPEWSTHGFCG